MLQHILKPRVQMHAPEGSAPQVKCMLPGIRPGAEKVEAVVSLFLPPGGPREPVDHHLRPEGPGAEQRHEPAGPQGHLQPQALLPPFPAGLGQPRAPGSRPQAQ